MCLGLSLDTEDFVVPVKRYKAAGRQMSRRSRACFAFSCLRGTDQRGGRPGPGGPGGPQTYLYLCVRNHSAYWFFRLGVTLATFKPSLFFYLLFIAVLPLRLPSIFLRAGFFVILPESAHNDFFALLMLLPIADCYLVSGVFPGRAGPPRGGGARPLRVGTEGVGLRGASQGETRCITKTPACNLIHFRCMAACHERVGALTPTDGSVVWCLEDE